MRRFLALLIAVLVVGAWPVFGDTGELFPDPGSLARELHRLNDAIRSGSGPEIARKLPPFWQTEASGRRYSVSTAPLRELIPSPNQAESWLRGMADQIEGFESAAPTTQLVRNRLDRILSRREFSGDHRPNFLQQRLAAWIQELLGRLFGSLGEHPATGKTLIWLIAVAAAVFLVFGLLHLRVRKNQMTEGPPSPPILQSSRQWLQWAREAANRGDLRSAIHASYWAGVVHLQDRHLLPEDFTRTPREYLACVTPRDTFYPPLAALTSELERFWYGGRAVRPGDFDEALNHLEALGCIAD